jgi:hypothetical protein
MYQLSRVPSPTISEPSNVEPGRPQRVHKPDPRRFPCPILEIEIFDNSG